MAIPLDAFEVSLEPDLPARVLATYDDPEEAGRWSLFELNPSPGYVAALAHEGTACEIVRQRVLEIPSQLPWT